MGPPLNFGQGAAALNCHINDMNQDGTNQDVTNQEIARKVLPVLAQQEY